MSFHPVSKRIEAILREEGCWYERFEHEPVRTSEEAAVVRPGYSLFQGSKALIVRVRKQGVRTFAMLVIPGDRRFDPSKARKVLQSTDIRFASVDEVGELTGGIQPGGVPPWGNLFGIPVYADYGVLSNEKIIFNAGDRSVSIAMLSADYGRLVKPVASDLS